VFSNWVRGFSSSTKSPTAVVMLNMGGPANATQTDVFNFLHRLFTDPDIIPLGPAQAILGRLIASRRSKKVLKQYEAIGGSPILRWTEKQGLEMSKLLDQMNPMTAPHKSYVLFRYTPPDAEEALLTMKKRWCTTCCSFFTISTLFVYNKWIQSQLFMA